ncbi:MAG TPA: ribosome maturation factor RimM [Woeseiaceae bacterium]|nr:ribosome maturation factor RimM [Woeseiaceae bacterium]
MALEPLVLGRVVGAFGVRGWVKVYSYTDPREALLNYKGLMLGRNGGWQSAEVVAGQRHGKSVIAQFEGVNDRDQAEAMVGADIGVSRDALPEPEDGRFYWSDLIGLKVVHRDGTELGIVESLLETGAHDVMVVVGDHERLIPFVNDKIVLGVDLSLRQIKVDWEWD